MNQLLATESAGRQPRNFVAHLRALAEQRANDVWLTVVDEVDGVYGEQPFTYAVFERRVRALAARLQQQFAKGDRALVMLDNGDHYAVSMLACFYCGVIAVPVFPPESTRPQHLARLTGVAADSQARCVLTSAAFSDAMAAAGSQFGEVAIVAVDAIDPALADAWQPFEPTGEDIAFLQYTSGSTSAPKGVIVTHGNLMANEHAIQVGMGIGPDDKFVSWAPLYHDMGLIGGLMQPLYSGIPLVLTSPRYFLERPVRWLELISRHRATLSGGPDFSFRLCLERVKDAQIAQLDLSSWRVAYTGAEPVRADTELDFIERFAPAGFDPGAVYACYGLAEATLFVTGGKRGGGMVARGFRADGLASGQGMPSEDGALLVGCGAVAIHHDVEIIDPATLSVVVPGRIGEIWVSGASIGAGYWGKPRESAETFVEIAGRRWLRTGDLGFVCDGELYVTGRIKDLIIVRGHNIYPQDIERVIETEVDAVRKGRVSAFSVDIDGKEGIGVAAEVSRGLQKLVTPQALVDALSEAVGVQCGEAPMVVLLLNPGALPRTSSGKLQRAACRRGWSERSLDAYALYEAGAFVNAADAPVALEALDETEQALASLWREALSQDEKRRYVRDTNFFGCGGNSLAAVQLAARIADRWAIDFPVSLVFEFPRLAALAQQVRGLVTSGTRQAGAVRLARSLEPRTEAPLSHAQERQWFLWQLDPGSSALHVGLALRLAGFMDAAALRVALNLLVERHESLRTVFKMSSGGTPAQHVRSAVTLDLPVVDLRALSREEQAARTEEERRLLLRTPFDLTQGPLLRLALIRLGDEDHQLLVVMHHIVSDGASMQVLLNELAALYGELRQDGTPMRHAPPIQYADYALWQREWLSAGEGASQLAWWREQLGDEHPVLALSTDHPRKAVGNYSAAEHAFELPAALLADLRMQAQAHGATLFMALLAGLQALLYRYTGLQDLRIGVPVANRQRPETLGLIGLFVNTLVLRSAVQGRWSLAQMLEQAKQAAFGAQARQDLPFEQLVEALRPERSTSHNPMVQVTINHVAQDFSLLQRGSGLAVTGHEVLRDMVQFDLTLEIRESPEGSVSAAFVYAGELFEASTIEALSQHYLAMLESLARHPHRAVADVPLLTPVELARLAVWGGLGESTGSLPHAHRMMELHAAQRPDAPALIKDGTTLSYGELNRRANDLAHRLIRMGIGPECRVGIAVERSVEMIVCLLATLKAGGAYVPLDPGYPEERLAYMMRDSGMALLLCQGALLPRLPLPEGLQVVDVDALSAPGEAGGGGSALNPDVSLHDANLAYVIYTSGSTGLPKGVEVAHGPLALHLRAIGGIYAVDPSHRELFFFSLSFDAAVEQWMTPLCGGGAIVLCDREQLDGPSFVEQIVRHGVTALHVPPAYLRVLGPLAGPASSQVRTCVVGGEAFPWADYELAQQAFEAPRLVNAYGPTETIITPTAWVGEAGSTRVETGYVPIGRPVGTRRAYVLDGDLNLLPRGVAGELYVGGAEIARGYARRTGLTADRFVADPFSDRGGRLYRTGDLVRWQEDGQLEYFGRLDKQVKVRGFRIELGEIEAQLLAQPGVREGVVLVHGDTGNERIVAYVCAQPGRTLEPTVLRSSLRESLPDYMVPNALVLLDALPLTPNGKIDRAALPAPRFGTGAGDAAPAGSLESSLAAIWAEVLGVERVGRHDNFFELGGHSLLLMKVHGCIAERLGLQVPMVDLFRYATVSALAASLATGGMSNAAQAPRIQARAARQRQHFLQRPATAEGQSK